MHVLVTGAAGFIGFHLALRLLEQGTRVVGIDNLNEYYDPVLKKDRLTLLEKDRNFSFLKLDCADREGMASLFSRESFDIVVHLAAQAGVRYSVHNPFVYADANILGFLSILEGCRYGGLPHLVFASTSSVYGANTKLPFSVHDSVDHPISLYAATKKANELMAHSYASLYNLPCTGLRFFTVYGPWGRPDMALFKFTKAILEDTPIDIYNYGKMKRDFTFIDDIIEGICRIMMIQPKPNFSWDGDNPDPATSTAPYRIYNIGGSNPVELMHFIDVLEKTLAKKAKKNLLPLQMGDVVATSADARDLETVTGFLPAIPIEEGIQRFVEWYRSYYRV
ncbi:MAG TPA: NAD-dependent epimerase [Deltaproteobacteria bacterium]|nr:NAD-dependent epimerase [Deltaproteobacteria bacterium]